jgi:hypothetical protein
LGSFCAINDAARAPQSGELVRCLRAPRLLSGRASNRYKMSYGFSVFSHLSSTACISLTPNTDHPYTVSALSHHHHHIGQYTMTGVKREVSMTPTPTPESDGSTASAIVKSTSPTSSASDDIDSKPNITTPSKKRGRSSADSTGKATKKARGAQGGSGDTPARRVRALLLPSSRSQWRSASLRLTARPGKPGHLRKMPPSSDTFCLSARSTSELWPRMTQSFPVEGARWSSSGSTRL